MKLRLLVPNFEIKAHQTGRGMRELLDSNRTAFPPAAIRVLQDPAAQSASAVHKGYQYLVTILLTQDLLMPIFVDAGIPVPFCIWLAQTAAKVDARFYLRVSNALDDYVLDGSEPARQAIIRVLDILGATMEPSAIAPILRKILLHPSAKIRSKATLLVGRSQTGVSAIERLLRDEDPRVRANAIESIWLNPDPRVIPMFVAGLDDSNNRAVGNAILGLYAAGSTKAIEAAFRLVKHPNTTFQGTGAWAMGATGDPRFLPILGKLVGESTGLFRKILFQALQSIKKKNAERSDCTMELNVLSSYVDGDSWRLRVCVKERVSSGNATLPATAFVIGTEAESVIDYSCELNSGKPLSMRFILPSTREYASESASLLPVIKAAIANFRAKKNGQEQWETVEYCSVVPVKRASMSFKFMGIEARAEEEPTLDDTPTDLFGAIHTAIENARHSAIPRHVVVILAAKRSLDLDAEDERTLIAGGRKKGIFVHVLSMLEDDQLKRISQGLGGSYQVLPSAERIEPELERLYERLMFFYAIEVPASVVKAGPITVRVNGASGWGKCDAEFPL